MRVNIAEDHESVLPLPDERPLQHLQDPEHLLRHVVGSDQLCEVAVMVAAQPLPVEPRVVPQTKLIVQPQREQSTRMYASL